MKIRIVVTLVLAFCAGAAGCKPRAASNVEAPATVAAPAAPAIAPSAAEASKFDLAKVPLISVALPPFPLLDWPKDLAKSDYTAEQSDFSQAWVLAGNQLRTVEGRVDKRQFYNEDAKLSALASRRNYAAAVKALGGVQVNAVDPDNSALVNANPENFAIDKLGVIEPKLSYDAYLVRAPGKNFWITVLTNDARTYLMTVEEKVMEQKVGFVRADTMRTELDRNGRIALYINFDTDKASLRADASPAVDEIASMLKKDPTLKLSIEGHTDNAGEARHNQILSQQRAEAVMATLIVSGVEKVRMSAAGLGSSKPLALDDNEAGRAKNRRVELVKVSMR